MRQNLFEFLLDVALFCLCTNNIYYYGAKKNLTISSLYVLAIIIKYVNEQKESYMELSICFRVIIFIVALITMTLTLTPIGVICYCLPIPEATQYLINCAIFQTKNSLMKYVICVQCILMKCP
jgi:hypothetical protein